MQELLVGNAGEDADEEMGVKVCWERKKSNERFDASTLCRSADYVYFVYYVYICCLLWNIHGRIKLIFFPNRIDLTIDDRDRKDVEELRGSTEKEGKTGANWIKVSKLPTQALGRLLQRKMCRDSVQREGRWRRRWRYVIKAHLAGTE